MKTTTLATLAIFALLVGCQQPAPTDMTYTRGAQLLAAGSPKTAIPLLAQTVAATPDGPEPVALLALAYALDMQPERAVLQVQQVRRCRNATPGWEAVAMAVAEMTRHRPSTAIEHLRPLTTDKNVPAPMAAAAAQWLAMAYALSGDSDRAMSTLGTLSQNSQMRTSALLWTVIIQSQRGQRDRAADALRQCAKSAAGPATQPAMARLSDAEGQLDDQALYDAAIAAMAEGNFGLAHRRFTALQQKSPNAGDAQVWQALIAAAEKDWLSARALLKQACGTPPIQSRGLANQLFAVVCAMEDRPDAMIEHLLAGQRMLSRAASPAYAVQQPKPDGVWGSDYVSK